MNFLTILGWLTVGAIALVLVSGFILFNIFMIYAIKIAIEDYKNDKRKLQYLHDSYKNDKRKHEK